MFETPFDDEEAVFALGVASPARGKLATSEKKKLVLTVGVPGVRAGVFITEPYPPGENIPLAVGDCSHAKTFDWSNEPALVGAFP